MSFDTAQEWEGNPATNVQWECSLCGAHIEAGTQSCPSCGESVEWDKPPVY